MGRGIVKKVVVVVIIIWFVVEVIRSEPPEQPNDSGMPRSRSFTNMEIGDIEYLQLMGGEQE